MRWLRDLWAWLTGREPERPSVDGREVYVGAGERLPGPGSAPASTDAGAGLDSKSSLTPIERMAYDDVLAYMKTERAEAKARGIDLVFGPETDHARAMNYARGMDAGYPGRRLVWKGQPTWSALPVKTSALHGRAEAINAAQDTEPRHTVRPRI
jgi:hypothetical protein